MSGEVGARAVRTIDELRELVGQEIAVSDWLEITQERVNLFADATGDHQYIHVDPERAKATFFGGTVAHGYLTLSLLASYEWPRQGVTLDLGGKLDVNYGLNKLRFPAPVPVGSRIRQRTTLLAVEEIGTHAVQMTTRETIEVEGSDKPACVAECLGRTYF